MAKSRKPKKAATRSPKAEKPTPREKTRGKRSKPAARQPAAKAKPSPKLSPSEAPAFTRWKAGESLGVLASEFKKTRSQMRKLLTDAAGGKEKFRTLRAEGAGGSVEPFGGKRATPRKREKGEVKAAPLFDDSKLPWVVSTSKRDGWAVRFVPYSTHMVPVAISPDGDEYVKALDSERADLLVKNSDLGTIRLKRLGDSRIAKQAKKQEKELQRGEAAIERTRARKRTARKQRKARKEKRS